MFELDVVSTHEPHFFLERFGHVTGGLATFYFGKAPQRGSRLTGIHIELTDPKPLM